MPSRPRDDDVATDDRELHLLELPAEILHHICSSLDVKDVRQFRLACRKLGDVGACHALPEVVFYLHKGDFDALRMIANHPVYPTYVRSLVYVTDVLSTELIPYAAYVAGRRKTERQQKHSARHHVWSNSKRFREPSPEKTKDQLKASYREYKRVHQQQCKILAQNEDFEVIKEVVAKFRNLEDVLVSSESGFREGHSFGHKTPFQNLYCHAHSYLEPEGTRQLKCILEAVEAAGIKLSSLRAGAVHWDFFREPLFETARWSQVCANLTRFEIQIQTESELDLPALLEDGQEPDFDVDGSEVEMCRRVMRAGSLKTLLANMPNLETLSIMFTFQDEESEELIFPASLSDLIPTGMRWPNLEILKLEIIETDRQELVDFLVRHKVSLLELFLKDIRLLDTSWLKFLPQLKQELGTHLMHDVLISGIIYGRNEEEGVDMEEEDEEWDLGDPDYEEEDNHLADQVTDYLLSEPDTLCPLNRENMDQSYYF